MDRNDCRFVGRIGERMKKGKTVNGEFKPAVIKYLEKLKVHVGTPIIAFGFVSTYTDELKGVTLKSNGINCNECYVIQTRPYND